MRTRYDRQATQKRILSTCVRLFLEQGFFNTPPKQIFTNYGKVTVEDHYDCYLYLSQGGNCTPPAQFRAAGCLLMAYFPQQPSWAHRGWGLQSQPLGVNWAAGKGMRLKSSQGSSAQPGESQHSLVGML